MISIEVNEKADNDWNKRLTQSSFGTTAQIKEMEFQINKNGDTPLFLKFIDSKGKIIGQLLISETTRFQDNYNKEKNFRNKIGRFSGILRLANVKPKIYRWSYGPVVFEPKNCLGVYEALKNFLLSDSSHQVLGWQNPLVSDGISTLEKNFSLIKWSTFMIDLSKPKNELFNNIDKDSGRKNIRRAEKRGIVVEEINENNLYDYFTLLNESKENRGELSSNYDYFLQLWKLFKPFGRGGFLARKDSKAISGLSFSSFCGHIIEGGVARSQTDKSNVYYSQDLIKWKIIEWGLENNMKWYNLAGFNPNPTNSKEEGILRYKKKWGGTQFDYYGIKLN
jgi:hypothetical protein